MDLSYAAIAGWQALLPTRLKVAIPMDATADWDGPAARLGADLTLDGCDIRDVLLRHAGTFAGFGAARRTRTLAWIATRTWGCSPGLPDILGQDRLAPLRPIILHDLDVLAGAAITGRPERHQKLLVNHDSA
jgi:hypothetical protein